MFTANKSNQGKSKRITAIGLLIASALGGFALLQVPVSAQKTPDVILYEGQNFTGRAIRLTKGVDSLGRFNNKTSSIKVLNNQRWQFWAKENKKGYSIVLSPGNYPSINLNNDIESLKGLK
ncbi:development-specific protein S (plasmid) [Calothrix sp. NIES-4071]|nr:development-specific protein S [Calothrix sp. NIES-4071]BAZ64801.1 development-specific protein S [Calothrix sp. NIES-4105]